MPASTPSAATPCLRARWLAGVLAGGEGAVLSHESAAALYGIGPPVVVPVHVTTATHRRSRPGLVLHRSSRPPDAGVRNGVPVTSVARTPDDLPPALATRARREAVVRGLLEPARVLSGPLR